MNSRRKFPELRIVFWSCKAHCRSCEPRENKICENLWAAIGAAFLRHISASFTIGKGYTSTGINDGCWGRKAEAQTMAQHQVQLGYPLIASSTARTQEMAVDLFSLSRGRARWKVHKGGIMLRCANFLFGLGAREPRKQSLDSATRREGAQRAT